MSVQIVQQVLERLQRLPDEAQQQVLDYVDGLEAQYRDVGPNDWLLEFVGAFNPEDVDRMEQAIEADCERVDPDEW